MISSEDPQHDQPAAMFKFTHPVKQIRWREVSELCRKAPRSFDCYEISSIYEYNFKTLHVLYVSHSVPTTGEPVAAGVLRGEFRDRGPLLLQLQMVQPGPESGQSERRHLHVHQQRQNHVRTFKQQQQPVSQPTFRQWQQHEPSK